MDFKGIVAAGAIVITMVGCQNATNAGVVNGCAVTVEVTANDANRVPDGSWESLSPGQRRYVVSMATGARTLWVFVRSPESRDEVATLEFEVSDLPRVEKAENNYVVEAALSGTACPG